MDNSSGGSSGAETITVRDTSAYVYTVFVELFIDADYDGTLLAESGATVDIIMK